MEELVSSEISGPWLEDISPQYSQEAGVSNKPKIKVKSNLVKDLGVPRSVLKV